MGNLLRILSREECPKYDDVFVDFENAQPTESEVKTYKLVQEVLYRSKDILQQLQTYKGAGNEIREAIANGKDEALQLKAWQTLLPLVDKLVKFYEFSTQLEKIVPELLMVLCSGNITPREHLQMQQATVKQLAEILDFVFKFDELKMKNPAIQNDFSYYRRTLNRRRLEDTDQRPLQQSDQNTSNNGNTKMDGPSSPPEDVQKPVLSNEIANKMSFFYAQATPMLKMLSDTTSKVVCDNVSLPFENMTETLSTMAQVCQRMIENSEFSARFQSEETIFFVLRVMVGVIILYDLVHPNGAFVKSSHIDIKGSIKLLREQMPSRVEVLLNALRYTTKHLHDESTPKQVKNLLACTPTTQISQISSC